jgi:site-specific DNA-methyltransferase (adenine-specific)
MIEYTLHNGDCVEILKSIEECSIDLTIASPPYDDLRGYNSIVDWDTLATQLYRVTKEGGVVVWNVNDKVENGSKSLTSFKQCLLFNEVGFNVNDVMIWEKTNPMPASGKNITNSYEFFIVLGNEPLKSNHTYTKNIISTSVNSNMPKEHKAVMKQEVSDWFIENFTRENDIVLDCFMGLGTTGKSCLRNNRSFIGIEINENYFKIAKADIESIIDDVI